MDGLKVDYLEFPDQDVINVVCKDRIMGLPPQYNCLRTFFIPCYRDDFKRQYSLQEWQNIKSIGTIHYTGAQKPWKWVTPMFTEWWNVYFELPKAIRKELPKSFKLRLLVLLDQFYPTHKLLKLSRHIARLSPHAQD